MKAHESLLPQIDAQVSQLVALAQPQATQWHAAISSQALARTDDTQAEVDQRVERIVALLERREKAKLAFRLAMQAKGTFHLLSLLFTRPAVLDDGMYDDGR